MDRTRTSRGQQDRPHHQGGPVRRAELLRLYDYVSSPSSPHQLPNLGYMHGCEQMRPPCHALRGAALHRIHLRAHNTILQPHSSKLTSTSPRLIFMTYNGWVMVAVAVGAFVGYVIFGNSTSSTKDNACH